MQISLLSTKKAAGYTSGFLTRWDALQYNTSRNFKTKVKGRHQTESGAYFLTFMRLVGWYERNEVLH